MKDNSRKSVVRLDFQQKINCLNSKIIYANDNFKINIFCQISSEISYSKNIRLKLNNFIKSSWISVVLKNCYFVIISMNLFRDMIYFKAFPVQF